MADTEDINDPGPQPIVLFSPGPLPGIPGENTPGVYTLDYDSRTLTEIPQEQDPDPDQSGDQQNTPPDPGTDQTQQPAPQ